MNRQKGHAELPSRFRRRRRLRRNHKGSAHNEAVLRPEEEEAVPETNDSHVDLALAHGVKGKVLEQGTHAFCRMMLKLNAAATGVAAENKDAERTPNSVDDAFGNDFVNISAEPVLAVEDAQAAVIVSAELVTTAYTLLGELSVTLNPPKLRFVSDGYKGEVRPCRQLFCLFAKR